MHFSPWAPVKATIGHHLQVGICPGSLRAGHCQAAVSTRQTLWENELPSTQFRCFLGNGQQRKLPLGWEAFSALARNKHSLDLSFWCPCLHLSPGGTVCLCSLFPFLLLIKAYIFLLLCFWHYFLLQIHSLCLAIMSRFVREFLPFWIWSAGEWSFAKYQLEQVVMPQSIRLVREILDVLRGLALFFACLCEFQQVLLWLSCHLLVPRSPSSVRAQARHPCFQVELSLDGFEWCHVRFDWDALTFPSSPIILFFLLIFYS